MHRRIKVLLVEDSIEDAAYTEKVLKFHRMKEDLVLATSGQEAIKALEGTPPDLILLDINLPDMSGIDLLTRIKEDPRLSGIPVVMLTGSNEDLDIQMCYDRGARTYLVKPVSERDFAVVMNNLF
ncbi:MAG: response regulator [Methanothrix sp.]|nr:response regulator [Methanothrix sp.]